MITVVANNIFDSRIKSAMKLTKFSSITDLDHMSLNLSIGQFYLEQKVAKFQREIQCGLIILHNQLKTVEEITLFDLLVQYIATAYIWIICPDSCYKSTYSISKPFFEVEGKVKIVCKLYFVFSYNKFHHSSC